MQKNIGKTHWVFADGELPPAGESEPYGHESLMVVNLNDEDAKLSIDILFEDKDPVKGLALDIKSERVRCIRLDKPVGEQMYNIPHGQYALVLRSTVPVVAVFGRLDVRQENMSYYSVQGYSCSDME